MLAKERKRQIKNLLLEKKYVTVTELSDLFGVSTETVRRDLKELETEGYAEKSYGGAVLKEHVSHTFNYDSLANVLVESKKQMAGYAGRLIYPGDTIFIDFSTTCSCLSEYLHDMPLTVMTNSLKVIEDLKDRPEIRLFFTGGTWNADNNAFTGPSAVRNIEFFHLDKAFISSRALSMDRGLSDNTEDEAALRRAAIENANQVYVLADHSKLGRNSFVSTADFSGVTAVITDLPLSLEWKEFLDERNIRHYDQSEPVPEDDGAL